MKYPIKTQRLTIRLAESEDAESIFSYRSDLEENKYQGWFPDSVEEVRDYGIVDFLFGTLNKHRVIASIDPRNSASIRLIERLGFRKEAHFKKSYYLHEEWVDDIIYAKLKTEWVNNDKYTNKR